MREFKIDELLVKVIQELGGNVSSSVLLYGQGYEIFRTSVSVDSECMFSPVLFSLLIWKIIQMILQYKLVADPTPALNSLTIVT
ncbi:hypothetical protein DPMN_110722 [Dreissena polymorpha]|uniref:Uncharacterized protein n=1 Tax=Dreissena polymorpha TaxID=45954 RepID=A0A9D4KCY1_DREPO|nr:hypothetical protein DPMN_110722 [Dreissena polymorpha]